MSDVLTTARLGFGSSTGFSAVPGVTSGVGLSGSGLVPSAVATLVTFPFWISSVVTTWLVVNVLSAPGSKLPSIVSFRPVSSSITVTPVSVKLPSFFAVIS